MGASDSKIIPIYKSHFNNVKEPVAILGSTNFNVLSGDLYDKQLENWDINSDWNLPKKYNTIVCTRCAYFSKDPLLFIKKCKYNLNENGFLYFDFGLGDHFRFSNFKVGWVKNNEHEFCYGEENKLFSCVWCDSFLLNEEYIEFEKLIKKFNYFSLKDAIFNEVPKILFLKEIENEFKNVSYKIVTLSKPFIQMYILIKAQKKYE